MSDEVIVIKSGEDVVNALAESYKADGGFEVLGPVSLPLHLSRAIATLQRIERLGFIVSAEKSPWISVEERLPAVSGYYLFASSINGARRELWFQSEYSLELLKSWGWTHWAPPLPEGPK